MSTPNKTLAVQWKLYRSADNRPAHVPKYFLKELPYRVSEGVYVFADNLIENQSIMHQPRAPVMSAIARR